jgi:nitroreductase
MPAKSTAAKPAVKSKSTSKPAAKSKAATKPAAKTGKPIAAAKSARKVAAKSTSSPKQKVVTVADPLEVVRPLVKVRQAREFTSRRVSKAELEAITEVARWSGSSRNEQACRFIVIRDRELIRAVAELGLPQTRGLLTATAVVAVAEPDEPERELSRAFDDGRAAERMLIAAHMLGLGGGISRVRTDVRPGIDKALKLPPNRSVRTLVGLGHPTEDALKPKTRPGKARLPRAEVVFEERWPEPPKQD